ncbi:MAG: DUF3048 domain-containing protein [Actinomycetota bacterium]
MTTKTKRGLAIGAAVLILAGGAFVVLSGRTAEIPGLKEFAEPATCPLSGLEPANEARIDRPAVAVKIENNPVAYPLSGLEEADLIYEEQVEGGLTRFMAMYHCNDVSKAGPVRSARIVDPAIMSPITRILAAAGGNKPVRDNLDEFDIVVLDENTSNGALSRVERPGISSEHTLYGDTKSLRRLGSKEFDDVPPDDLFTFGELEDGKSKKTSRIILDFGNSDISYEWTDGQWFRFDSQEPLMMESGDQLGIDNVLIEEHTINLSGLSDVLGTPSPEIEDVTGNGRAILFRDGRMIMGQWSRESVDDPVVFTDTRGEPLVLAPGRTLIELLPNQEGDVKGSFTREK